MDFEKLGSFYLGKLWDSESGELLNRPLLYDARDLTTHALCVGMTGSGKTGLCIDLLEEAAIDQVPAIIIDPKGDITNLLLQFPDLAAQDFRPWINLDDARRKDLSPDEFAAKQAALWRDGLASWGQGTDRLKMLSESAEFSIFTPGSDAGTPVSVLRSFKKPPLDWSTDAELLREQISGITSGLLGLAGIDSDPVQSREHILISQILEHAWRAGSSLDVPSLLRAIQNPPVRQVGVFDVDSFFPEKDRFALAMRLNNLIASPAFAGWTEGEPLDIPNLLTSPSGKPRHSIFYLAHLGEAERMFFVTLLLGELSSWIRAQPGSTSLRAICYMDEIFGFFPPVANPPSKKPMLTLLKQARAFGLGIVLATQNPVDLDYKGLSNVGTWFVGRLQTERDRARLLDGLDNGSLDRKTVSGLLSNLDKRVFLLRNIHEPEPVTFQTRWAMSYLRGPLTRPQIKQLVGAGSTKPDQTSKTENRPRHEAVLSSKPPAAPPGVTQLFESSRENECDFRPALFADGLIRFRDGRRKIDEAREFFLMLELDSDEQRIDWARAEELESSPRLFDEPPSGSSFGSLPRCFNEQADTRAAERELVEHLYYDQRLLRFKCEKLKLNSLEGETRSVFQLRVGQEARERRDDAVEKLKLKFAKKIQTLEGRLVGAENTLEKKQGDASGRKTEMLLGIGESLWAMFSGRSAARVASSSMRRYRMSSGAQSGVEAAEDKVRLLEEQIESIQEEMSGEIEEIRDSWERVVEDIEEISISPRKSSIEVNRMALVWRPGH